MTPHTHAALIHAWAEGATIQFDIGKGWQDYKTNGICGPSWDVHKIKFRIKPPIIRYKRYLMDHPESVQIHCLSPNSTSQREVEGYRNFIKWIDTEWQGVEV